MQQIGRYQIRKPLGAGAMADVFEAFDPEINRTLAIKVLKTERCVDDEYVSRFVREAKAAGAMSHKNIVTIFDVGEHEDKPYILMEMVDGAPMDELLKKGEKLSLKSILSIGVQLADALDYAHKKGIVHRDIKPSNIMFLKDGETVKITDFGIARVEDPADQEKTMAGMVLGTPQYMSPEQVLGKSVDGRSDLFSVGVVLYQLLTGKKPFPGETIGSLMVQITKEEAPSMRGLNTSIPVGVQHIVEKLLAKSPDGRFQDGKSLKSALTAQIRQLEDAEHASDKPGYIPLRYKLTGAMALGVAVVMIVSVALIQSRLSDMLTDLTIDSGTSLANFIATVSALPLIQEEQRRLEAERAGREPSSRSNAKIERFVEDTMRRQSFAYLHVANRNGVVRASSDPSLIGEQMPIVARIPLRTGEDGLNAAYARTGDGERVFDFSTPITLRDTNLGEVRLGMSRAPVSNALGASLLLLSVLAAIIVAAVCASAYYLIGLLSKPLKTLRMSMEDLAEGNVDVRISQMRDDEVGDVFAAFNTLAASIGQTKTPTAAADDAPHEDAPTPLACEEADAALEDATVLQRPAQNASGDKEDGDAEDKTRIVRRQTISEAKADT
ncbi:MAG: protein kinase [Pseudomonadota bacterium]